ncbi:hypothetical protein PENTCL1PPCAC_3514 [Pristionchus entomophagus]|uniref:MD-2-related lipid-recognition domain-containing protein n=1 Tax=Pristionchus entomophagus TaxID=358040 RepID=A0AAV5SMH5_9BILA|nr:hypothetical protein PENTCL1PPCAC_3514 [Pristionchus entomophagus]
MLQLILVFSLAVSLALAACPFPNGTDTAINMYSCASSVDTISISSYKLTDVNGNPMYPVVPSKPFVLDMQSFNSGPVYTDVKASVRIFEYQKSWTTGQCAWSEIPTFGALDNIDACDFASNCPWLSGDLDLNMVLDFSDYSNIISMLTKNSAVQLQLTLKNYNEGSKHEEIGCFIGQMKIQ